jgi:transitional endoplasmic reticulum ATPase
MSAVLPAWAEAIRSKYLAGEASMFALHLNVFDEQLYEGRFYSLTEFITEVLLRENKRNVVIYDPAAGLTVARDSADTVRLKDIKEPKPPKDLLPVLETLLFTVSSVGLIITYTGALAPAGEFNFLSEQDRNNIVMLHRWSLSRELAAKDNVVFMVTEMLSELHPMLMSNPRVAAIEIPLPDPEMRAEVIRKSDPHMPAAQVEVFAKHTAGLRCLQIKALLTPRANDGPDDDERKNFVAGLLGDGPDVAARAEKLAGLTRGLALEEIRKLINPDRPITQTHDSPDAAYADVLELVHKRKREIIEKECAGLIEFVDSKHDLSAVGGNEYIKDELRRIAANVKSGDRARVPMGLLFVGPMGTGKTFVANAFVRESGLSAVKLKNFRSKWVGSTEANLEKVLSLVRSLGPIILIIDEGDRAFGGGEQEDGGTSSRIIARLKEFMSDPENRGRVLTILMTNRPDKLDVDIKRAGRLDRKIPFFYASEPAEVEQILTAQLRRYGIKHSLEWPRDREALSAKLLGLSNADLEAVCLLANDIAKEEQREVTPDLFAEAITEYLPSRDTRMLEYMELLAVFEASRRSMVPERYRNLGSEELNNMLRVLRAELKD